VDFALSDTQRSLRDAARAFARDVIRPVAAQFDEAEATPWDVLARAHALGFDTYGLPAAYGGGVDDPLAAVLIGEELAWGCAGIATAVTATQLCAMAIAKCGTEPQKAQFLRRFSDPERVVLGAMALTEPGAGSDIGGITTVARRDGDAWVLNGVKRFITNGGIADVHVVFATTDPGLGWRGIQAFVVEKGTPGLSMGRKERTMGVRASHTADVLLDDCRVAETNRLPGPAGSGGLGALKTLETTRPAVAAAAVGIARAALEFATAYAHQRDTFGKPLVEHQAIAFLLADMATHVEAARLLVWQAAWRAGQRLPFAKQASMAKLYAGDMAVRATLDAIQVLGGYGYIRDNPVEKWARDAKIYQIWEGSAEMQRVIISRELSAEHRSSGKR
jgi:alkylation response protein AidB-like acyl-CoA dehydrogenase